MVAEIHTLPQPLERLATQIRCDLERRKSGDREWIEGTFDLCVHLAQAKRDNPAKIDFGQWCSDNGFGEDALDKNDRASAITMGEEPEAARKCLESTTLKSLRLIQERDFPRFSINTKTKKKPKKNNLQPDRRKNETPQAESAALEVLDKGKTYNEVAAATGLSSTVLRSAIAREEGRREGAKAAAIDKIILPMTAQQKLDAAIRRERTRLEVEFATLKAGIKEEVRQRVVKGNAEYLAMLKEREADALRDQEYYTKMINNHIPPFSETEFMSIWRCLHSDSRSSLSAARLDAAFTLFNSKRLQLTGKKS